MPGCSPGPLHHSPLQDALPFPAASIFYAASCHRAHIPELASPLLSDLGGGLPLHPWHGRAKHGLAANYLSVSLFYIPDPVLPPSLCSCGPIYLNVLPPGTVLSDPQGRQLKHHPLHEAFCPYRHQNVHFPCLYCNSIIFVVMMIAIANLSHVPCSRLF